MNRILIVLIVLFLPLLGFAQRDTLISYTGVIQVDGSSKDLLFQNGRQWYNKAFVSSKDVLQIIDKETGELSGKGLLKSHYQLKVMGGEKRYDCYYRFSLDIKVKDGRYRYTFSNFSLDETLSPGIGSFPAMTSTDKCPNKYPMVRDKKADALYMSMKAYLDTDVNALIESLKLEMVKKVKDDF